MEDSARRRPLSVEQAGMRRDGMSRADSRGWWKNVKEGQGGRVSTREGAVRAKLKGERTEA